MSDHIRALRAVAADTNGVPNCDDRSLTAARDAGLITFKAWPSGHWQLTAQGRAELFAHEDATQ